MIIEVKNLAKHFKQVQKKPGFLGSLISLVKPSYKLIKAVDDISFSINSGEFVAFLGPNGAGKTTTLKMLSGILYRTSGEANVLGFDPQKRQANYQRQISIVMGQKNQLWWDLPPIDTFELNKEIYEIPKEQYQETLAELIELLDVKEILNTQVKKLSLGQRMKCELIVSLLHKPRVIFLDEPTIGLDINTQKKVRQFLREYNQKTGATIMLTSHNMDDVSELCKRAIIIDHGHKIFDGELADLTAKYAKEKYLEIDFEKQVEKKDLEKYGKIVSANDTRVVLSVSREEHTKIAGEILSKFEVDNLDINEISLEDIVRQLF